MCGRYRLKRWELAEAVAMGTSPKFDEFSEIKINPHFERLQFVPSNQVPIVRLQHGQRIIDMAKWGFVPVSGVPSEPSINARGETVASKGKFRTAFAVSRCLLPADGFYEPKGPKGMKHRPQFYFHRPDEAVFAMAGIFSQTADGLTCAIITITPNDLMAPIHDRMPVILQPADYAAWLDPATDVVKLESLIKPVPEADLIFEPEQFKSKSEPGLFD